MRKRPEQTVNLVRSIDSDTWQYNVSDFDLTLMRSKYKVVPEKPRYDAKTNTHVHYYITMPK